MNQHWLHLKPFVAAWLAVLMLQWTTDHGSTDLAQFSGSLTADAQECSDSSDETCPRLAANIQTRWISRTGSGNLFLVMQTDCRDTDQCSSWFVERTAQGTTTRLNVQGQFQVLHGNKPIPDVQTWRVLSDSETEYTRYTWVSGAYLKTETRSAYRVDGVECGSALECYQAASKARDQHKTGRALKIWEKVHKVSWI